MKSKQPRLNPPVKYDITPRKEMLRMHMNKQMEDLSQLAGPEERLFLALTNGNIKKIKEFLDAGLNPNTELYGQSMLSIVKECGQNKVIQLLIERGAKESE